MFTHEITYEDWDENKVTDTLYFNLTKIEMAELNLSFEGGLEKTFQKIQKEDPEAMFMFVKKILLLAYGVKSDDGREFVKNDDLREKFTQTRAYDIIFTALAEDETFGEAFLRGVFPKELIKEYDKQIKTQNALLPPTPGEAPKE